jgi:hypothetical protein
MEKPKRKVSKPPRYNSPANLSLIDAEIALRSAEESVQQVEKTVREREREREGARERVCIAR